MERSIISEIKEHPNDVLYVKTLSIPPFNNQELMQCAEKLITEKGFSVKEEAWDVFQARIAAEKSDGRFYGINTIRKVIREMLYIKQTYNVDIGLSDKEIHRDEIVSLVDDLPMDILFAVRPERQIVQLISPMPFNVPEDKHFDIALAATVVNNRLVDGSFDFDMADGKVSFRLTASYIESILGKELFQYMLMVSASTIDAHNDKFFMISKNMMSFEQFLESEN